MKKAWDTHKLCTRCKKTRTKGGTCAKCSKLKPLAHLLARIERVEGHVYAAGNLLFVWCSLGATLGNVAIVLSPRDATHQGYVVCEACLMARDT